MSKVFISQEERCQQWLTDTLNSNYNIDSDSIEYSYKSLGSINPSIVAMKNLTKIILYQNKITEFPIELCTMTQLNTLNLGYNKIPSLPEEIGNLTNLVYLSVSNNKLTSLPESFGDLIELKKCFLYENDFSSGLIDSFSKLTNLNDLQLYKCKLNDITQLSNLTSVKLLLIQDNNITIIPETISALTSLTGINIKNNPISDYSPLDALNLTKKNNKILC
eukprot:TRINITY_DN697_c0_g3_i2.p1 TRINITY_DN697_c0_g3~~TRINITY_DN697_c0_g3_i2.p1  ORF type:complete len:220 (+),score=29.70 TRINITY_DN697_c0_g3_i2:146-805(+)